MISKEVSYIFYIDVGKSRKYLKPMDKGVLKTTPFMHEAKVYTLFKEGLKEIKKYDITKGILGYVKITKNYEFRTVV